MFARAAVATPIGCRPHAADTILIVVFAIGIDRVAHRTVVLSLLRVNKVKYNLKHSAPLIVHEMYGCRIKSKIAVVYRLKVDESGCSNRIKASVGRPFFRMPCERDEQRESNDRAKRSRFDLYAHFSVPPFTFSRRFGCFSSYAAAASAIAFASS